MVGTVGWNKDRETVHDDFGTRLQRVRRAHEMSQAELAHASGLSRRRVAALERGKAPISDSELSALAAAFGVGVGAIAPPGSRLTVAAGALSTGGAGELRGGAALDAVLLEYVSMVAELRGSGTVAPSSLRQDDLEHLASAVGGTPKELEARLTELLGTNQSQGQSLAPVSTTQGSDRTNRRM